MRRSGRHVLAALVLAAALSGCAASGQGRGGTRTFWLPCEPGMLRRT